MTEAVIKKLGIFDKTTREYKFTIIFKKEGMFDSNYARCDEDGDIVDVRTNRSFAKLSPKDKLRPVKGYYKISANKSESFDDECYVDIIPYYESYSYIDWDAMASSIQKLLSAKVVFITGYNEHDFYVRQTPIDNVMYNKHLRMYLGEQRVLVTEDSLGEDIPIPDRFMKRIKARKDKERKKQSRIKLFETFILPGVIDIEGFHYDRDDQKFYMDEVDIYRLTKKYIEEVVISKFEEAGAHMSIDDFKVGPFMYCKYEIPLENVTLDNIDDVE
jgi:hypothetical protein